MKNISELLDDANLRLTISLTGSFEVQLSMSNEKEMS